MSESGLIAEDPGTSSRVRATLIALYLVCLAICWTPIFSTTIPPLVDYPNHLARMHILVHWEHDEVLQEAYRVDWRPLPNLDMDLIVPTLARARRPVYHI